MAILKKDLQALKKEIKALDRKMEKLIREFDKSKKANVKKKVTAKTVKAKTIRKAPAKKVPAKKKTAQPTAIDQVLKILRGRKKGVDAAALMKKTGFDNKKIQNILHRTHKIGKIKRVGKGIYVGAD